MTTNILLLLALGLMTGAISGLIGIGGGLIVVPSLVFFFGFSQHQAQGTSLAMMIPPVGLLAVLTYYRQGDVDIKVAACLCLGFLVGGFFGAKLATGLSNEMLSRVFGGALLLISLKMLWGK